MDSHSQASASPTFLATTALVDFWGESPHRVFLSEWCRRRLTPEVREQLDGEVLPNPWDEVGRLDEACARLEADYEALLRRLATYLNSVHGVAGDVRYWRVLIGPWLLHYLHGLYDRVAHLDAAFARFPSLHTLVLDPDDYRVPFDTLTFARGLHQDDYNLQVFSQLLRARGHVFPTRRLQPAERSNTPVRQPRAESNGRRFREIVGAAATGTLLRLARAQAKVVLSDLLLPTRELWSLSVWSAFRAAPAAIALINGGGWRFTRPEPLFDRARRGLGELGDETPFGAAVAALLPHHFPVLFLEAFPLAAAEIRARHSIAPEVVVSAVGWYYFEPFKFFAAQRVAEGGRLVAVQHGTEYGTSRRSAWEQHELKIADRFVTWGWGEGAEFAVAPSLRISRMPARRSPLASDILFVSTAIEYPLYSDLLNTNPLAGQWERYFADQIRFLGALPPSLLARIRFRPHPLPTEQPFRRRLERRFPQLRWDARTSFEESICDCSLAVIDHPGTTMLQSLGTDVPTLLFWEPALWPVRAAARPAFAQLMTSGILSDRPEEAAERLAGISSAPDAWWTQPKVQKARVEFVDRYARASPAWKAEWGRLLRQLPRIPARQHTEAPIA